jgi:hypothetical protein
MTGTAHDLDALLNEIDGAGQTVLLFGREWTLPTDVDAETMLRVQRLQMQVALAKKNGVELSESDVVDDNVALDELVRRMAGDENYEAWRELGLGYKGMQLIAGRLYAIHNNDGSSEGKGPKHGPARQTRSRTGSARSGQRATV